MFNTNSNKAHRALIIDDEKIFHDMICDYFKILSIDCKSVFTFDEAANELIKAVKDGNPFSLVTIDNELKIGNSAYRLGKNILQKIKLGSEFASLDLGCIMITATRFSEREVLNLRDKFGLDYFIPKDELDIESLREGVSVASTPHKAQFDIAKMVEMPSNELRLVMLNDTLITYKNICMIHDRNLAILREKKARDGGDLNLKIENEIRESEKNIKDTECKINEIENQINALKAECL